ncbi:hypothetical protein INR49_015860 [Caranx melampygus]|nr:hypothetical protein INR49_015860 [Caranx melampygus]
MGNPPTKPYGDVAVQASDSPGRGGEGWPGFLSLHYRTLTLVSPFATELCEFQSLTVIVWTEQRGGGGGGVGGVRPPSVRVSKVELNVDKPSDFLSF